MPYIITLCALVTHSMCAG